MNKFKSVTNREKSELSLRDIIVMKFLFTNNHMIYQKNNGKIGLLDIVEGISSDLEFDNLETLNSYFRELQAEDDVITIVPSHEWVVYVP